MKTRLLKGLAVAVLVGFTVAAQAVSISGSVGFNAQFSVNNPNLLLVTAINDSGLLALGTGSSGPLGTYLTELGSSAFPLNIKFNNGVDLNFTSVAANTPFNVYTFSWNSRIYTMVNNYFEYKYETLTGGNLSLTLSGLGTAYITEGLVDVYEPTAGTWILNGIQASGQANPTWTFNTYVGGQAVPDGGTTLFLLGLALSGLGLIRRKVA